MAYKPKEFNVGDQVTPRCHLCKEDRQRCNYSASSDENHDKIFTILSIERHKPERPLALLHRERGVYAAFQCLLPAKMAGANHP